jgi:iron complex transport system ATP-binding protein
MFETRDLHIGYKDKKGEVSLLKHLNLTIKPHELVCFMGPNGVGKSTLIRSIAGLQPILGGQALLNKSSLIGASPELIANNISLVLTEKVNTLNIYVEEMIGYGRYPHLNWRLKFSKADEDLINNAISQTNINHLRGKKMFELSDGQAQMVMIARALVQNGQLVLLDEPTAHLDLNNRVEIMNLLRKLAHETGKAILVATHELDLALQTADTIWLAGFDKKIKTGVPEDLVLDGSIDAVFQFKGFDLKTGKVNQHTNKKTTISITGEGHGLLWTKNALERNGYELNDSSEINITISHDGNLFQWSMIHKDRQEIFFKLSDLLHALPKL